MSVTIWGARVMTRGVLTVEPTALADRLGVGWRERTEPKGLGWGSPRDGVAIYCVGDKWGVCRGVGRSGAQVWLYQGPDAPGEVQVGRWDIYLNTRRCSTTDRHWGGI